jgi:hypothetical protein
MTVNSDLFRSDFDSLLGYGQQVRLRYFTQTFVSGSYDDDIALTKSGTDLYVSGIVQPISNKQNNSESLLLEQGKILMDDRSLYIAGDIDTTELSQIKVGLGSPVGQEFQILGDGMVTEWNVNGVPIYKKMFIRNLTNGSFVGE